MYCNVVYSDKIELNRGMCVVVVLSQLLTL